MIQIRLSTVSIAITMIIAGVLLLLTPLFPQTSYLQHNIIAFSVVGATLFIGGSAAIYGSLNTIPTLPDGLRPAATRNAEWRYEIDD